MEPESPAPGPAGQKSPEQRAADMQQARQKLSQGHPKSWKLAALVAIAPTYIASLFVPDYRRGKGLALLTVVYVLATALLARLFMNWVGKRPWNSSWRYFLD